MQLTSPYFHILKRHLARTIPVGVHATFPSCIRFANAAQPYLLKMPKWVCSQILANEPA